MRNNQPVTQREYRIPEHYRLISSTDKRGVIQHCNQQFVEVSGFTREELIGEHHNLVRHPDMPPAVFKEMWKTLAAGKIWMGLVKNRRKNGDHYWVSAFVTPIFDAGSIVGYESVRVPVSAEEIKRAELRYARLRQGKSSIARVELFSHYAVHALPTLLTGAATTGAVALMGNLSLAALTLLGFSLNALWCQRQQRAEWQQLMALSPDSYRNVMVAQTYFDDYGVRAQAKLVLACELARSRTALTRIDDASKGLDDIAKRTYEQAQTTNTAFVAHNQATQQIASAITQMSHAIQEVAERVEANALSAQTAAENVATGNHKAEQSLQAIIELRQAVESISSTVQELAQSTNDIGEAASIISTIADQTNLLALNAAIEAARAGEQGRGFAVVADEVRSLASKTRQSTDKIHHIIQALSERSSRAVKVSEAGVESAQRGAEIVEETRIALNQINQAVAGITDMTVAMSAAVEEQSTVAEHIDRQINEVAEGAEDMAKAAGVALEANAALTQTVENVHSVITRFSTNK